MKHTPFRVRRVVQKNGMIDSQSSHGGQPEGIASSHAESSLPCVHPSHEVSDTSRNCFQIARYERRHDRQYKPVRRPQRSNFYDRTNTTSPRGGLPAGTWLSREKKEEERGAATIRTQHGTCCSLATVDHAGCSLQQVRKRQAGGTMPSKRADYAENCRSHFQNHKSITLESQVLHSIVNNCPLNQMLTRLVEIELGNCRAATTVVLTSPQANAVFTALR